MNMIVQRAIYKKEKDQIFLHRGDLEKTFRDEPPKNNDSIIYSFCHFWFVDWLRTSECPSTEDVDGTLETKIGGTDTKVKLEFCFEAKSGTYFNAEDLLKLLEAKKETILSQMAVMKCREGDEEVVRSVDRVIDRVKLAERALRQANKKSEEPRPYVPNFSLN